MVNCCKNSFRICDSFVGCPVELLIKIPESYIEPTITIRIYKGDSVVEVTKSVIDGYATIFLDEELPDGFINGYGSPIYEVFMFNPTTLEIVELQASGDPVTSLIFQVTAGTSLQNQFKLDY
jgi:hypothetical protein